jgi:hypothetical protein
VTTTTGTTDFVLTTPPNLGRNAFFEQRFFDNGTGDTTKVQACFSGSGAVAFVNYCTPPPVAFNSLAIVDDTDMQSDDLLSLSDVHQPSLQTAGSFTAGVTKSVDKPIESICPRWQESFLSGQCLNFDSDSVPELGPVFPSQTASKFFPTGNFLDSLSTTEGTSILLPKSTDTPPTKADMIDCDFSMFDAGDYVTSACSMDIAAYSMDSHGYTPGGAARVFDSYSPPKGCGQLGAPNEDCPTHGPGQGLGGSPLHQPNPANQNCNGLGNLLIVQKTNEEHPFSSETGGCINFSFVAPVALHGVGVLDIPPDTTVMYTVCV